MAGTEATPDPKPAARVRLSPLKYKLLCQLLLVECEGRCECGCGRRAHSAHHLIGGRGRSDVRENLVMLNGDGTRGCHGALTSANLAFSPETGTYVAPEEVRSGIRRTLETRRREAYAYLLSEKGETWVNRFYPRESRK